MPSILFFLLSPPSRLGLFHPCVVVNIALGVSSNSSSIGWLTTSTYTFPYMLTIFAVLLMTKVTSVRQLFYQFVYRRFFMDIVCYMHFNKFWFYWVDNIFLKKMFLYVEFAFYGQKYQNMQNYYQKKFLRNVKQNKN